MNTLGRRQGDDDGVALVMALVFLLVVGLFIGTALNKSESVSTSGQQVRVRGQLQYALDGGIDRALQVLRDDLSGGSPSKCVEAPEPETDITDFKDAATGLELNGQKVSYSCQTLAGKAALAGDAANANHAIVVTSPNDGALTTQSAASSDLVVDGSVYLNGKVVNGNLDKKIVVKSGDIVSPISRAGCAADLAALTQLEVETTSQLKACTEQTLAEAVPTVTLPAAPTVNASTLLGVDGQQVNIPGPGSKKCQVYLPGRYTSPPTLGKGSHYFVSGLYYFHNIGKWTIDGDDEVTAGANPGSEASVVSANDCATMTDATAKANAVVQVAAAAIPSTYFATSGATFVFGGNSQLEVKKGALTMFTPPSWTGTEPAVNLVAVSSTANGYTAVAATNHEVLSDGTVNTKLRFNAKVLAPTARIEIFTTNSSIAAAPAGVIAYTLHLQASASSGGGLAISAPGGVKKPPPPYRTVRIVTRDKGGSSATNTAVATISNFSPYTVSIKSWRTDD